MKRRIFTLLAIGMLVGGISSTLKAQSISAVSISNSSDGALYEKKVKDGSSLVSQTVLKITLDNINLFPGNDTTIFFMYNGTAEYLGLPASYKIQRLDTILGTSKTFPITVEHNWDMPNTVNGTKGLVYASFDKTFPSAGLLGDTTVYYNYPTFTVEYMPTTSQFEGSLRVSNITGSNPNYSDYMTRTLRKDSIYGYFTDTTVFVPFSDIEVANLDYGDKISVKTAWETYVLDIPRLNEEVPPGTITRPVSVPTVSNAILSVEPGIKQVVSSEDFSFTITPTGSNVGLVPVVKTGRTNIPDSEGVIYKQLSDGSWFVTIVRVQSAITLTIDFTTSNATIENSSSVWANGGQLYVNAVTSNKASIYSITGALVKTVNVAAGETASISLPTGFYIVTVNGKAYKVTVK
ncbi:MAG: T9SS type A sorting domain-containing protein [Tannerella sp.]|jgi:hypothetical protein|nr:T9SS type A sorting domain-containing protein [Tannerella sp.]